MCVCFTSPGSQLSLVGWLAGWLAGRPHPQHHSLGLGLPIGFDLFAVQSCSGLVNGASGLA